MQKTSGNAELTSEYKLTIAIPMHDPVTKVLAQLTQKIEQDPKKNLAIIMSKPLNINSL